VTMGQRGRKLAWKRRVATDTPLPVKQRNNRRSDVAAQELMVVTSRKDQLIISGRIKCVSGDVITRSIGVGASLFSLICEICPPDLALFFSCGVRFNFFPCNNTLLFCSCFTGTVLRNSSDRYEPLHFFIIACHSRVCTRAEICTSCDKINRPRTEFGAWRRFGR